MDSFEREARLSGYHTIAGIDEAGRGPLAGPVVAAAVVLPSGYGHPGINDSKCLTPLKRTRMYEVIRRDALAIGVGVVESSVIDEINILQATLRAMKEAVESLSIPADYLLIDGITAIPLACHQKTIVRGDGRSVSIAAASIIAKVSRDRIMEMYHRQFPQYGFDRNKGYGTPTHLDALRQYGCCKIHRRTFQIRRFGASLEKKNPVPLFERLSWIPEKRSGK